VNGQVRWGILGAGSIAERFAGDIHSASGAELAAVGARSLERAQGFADRHGVPRAFGSYADLVAADDIDAIYIATPHSLHHEHALLAINAGKSVLIEKPFTVSTGEAAEIQSTAAERGVFAMEAMWTVCNPLVRKLADRVRSGAIGPVLALHANVGPMGFPAKRGGTHRTQDRSLGASFMLETFSYPLWLITTIAPQLRQAENISAIAAFGPEGIDEIASLQASAPNGPWMAVTGGFAFESSASAESRLHVIGAAGWAEIRDSLFDPRDIRIHTASGTESLATEDADRGFAYEIEEASRAILAGHEESPLVSLSQSIDVMSILDRARSSALTKEQ